MKTRFFVQHIRTLFTFIGILAFIIVLNSCSMSYSKMMNSGSVQNKEFKSIAPFEIVLGLIIVPVEMNGNTYRFLFDTGATTSISTEIDKILNKKAVYKGGLTDSDNHKSVVKYVILDSLKVGGASFYEQSAFVHDYTKNPILKCMKLDGILGSNTMRYCNWTIDYEKQEICLTNRSIDSAEKYIIPFDTDHQYNMKVDLKLGELNISNLKIDYGSNGSLSLPKSIINELVEKGAIDKTTTQIGYSQSGISGKVSKIEDLNAFTDSLYYNELVFKNVPIRTGKGLIGGRIFTNWIIDIDWGNYKLYFTPQKEQKDYSETFGLFINYSSSKGAYIQSIISGSSADKGGLEPEMKVLRVNDVIFYDESDFCNYLSDNQSKDQISIEVISLNGDTLHMKLNKSRVDY